jgi:hypothetical protein
LSNDLLSLGAIQGPAQAPRPAQQAQQAQQAQPAQPSGPPVIELLSVSDFVVLGQAQPHPTDRRQIALRLLVYGTGSSPLTDFRIAFNPSPGWQIRQQPIEPAVLQPARQNPIQVLVYLSNVNNSPFQLQVKASYKFGAQPLSATGTIIKIPPLQ